MSLWLVHTIKKRFIMKNFIITIHFVTFAAFAATMMSCNVTRVITNESKSLQRGDTAIIIQTKTIETYDATSKGLIR